MHVLITSELGGLCSPNVNPSSPQIYENQPGSEQKSSYRPAAHEENFVDVLMRLKDDQLLEKLNFQHGVND